MLATMADAHREWHTNTGTPMGTPGCPQDACHPIDDEDYGPPVAMVRCGCGCDLRVPVAVVRSHFGLLPKATIGDLR